MNRRNFMQQSMVFTLAGMAMPLQSFSSAAPVRVAVIGTGGRGTDLIRKLSTVERAEIVAVCDTYEPHLNGGGDAAGPQAQRFADYKKMLKQVKPEAVVIAAPLYLHFEMSKAAIKAGCAVFCEKTMCYSIDEARELTALVRKHNAVFQVGLQRRASSIYQQAMSMVDEGLLGRIYAIKCQWHRNNDWRRPVPVGRENSDWQQLEHQLNWRLYWPYSQGLMSELGAHQLDVVAWALKTNPKRVLASGGLDYWRDGREVFDNVYCIYEYEMTPETGEPYTVRATYSSIQSNAYEGASELLMGTKGTLLLTEGGGLFYQEAGVEKIDWNKNVQANQQAKAEQDAAVITSGKTLNLSNNPWAHRGKPHELSSDSNSTRDQLISFLDCVQRGDTKTICDVEAGMVNSATILIANQAMKEGRTIEFPVDM